MVTHIVMWKLKEQDKEQNKLQLRKELLALEEFIPQIKSIAVDFNLAVAPSENYDVVLTLIVDSWEDLDIYAKHPEHVKLTDFVRSIVTSRVAIDY
ncbi:Dabb family protein [Myroides sp. LJL115]